MRKERVVIDVVDDIDGKSPATTLTFEYFDVPFEIDLSDENATALNTALAEYDAAKRNLEPFLTAARAVREEEEEEPTEAAELSLVPAEDVETKPKRKSRRSKKAKPENSEIRAWAADNGIEVAAKGKIPQSVVDQFLAAS